MEKGAFKGKKLSEFQNKNKNKETPKPDTGIVVSSDAVWREAQNRIEKVNKEVLSQRSTDDRSKEGLIFEILNRGPKEVRVATLELLNKTIANMVNTEALANRARLRNVRAKLTEQHPLENINASVDAFIDEIETQVFSIRHTNHSEFIVNRALNLEPQLIRALQARLPNIIANHDSAEKSQAYQTALQFLANYLSTVEELEKLASLSEQPAAQAKAYADRFVEQLNHPIATNGLTFQHLIQQANHSIQNASPDFRLALLKILLSQTPANERESTLAENMVLACLRFSNANNAEVQTQAMHYLGRSDDFQVWTHHQDVTGRMQVLNILQSLQKIPALVAATLRRTQLNQYQADQLKTVVKKLPFDLSAGEAWSDAALKDLTAMPEKTRSIWMQFLQHANNDKPKPSAAWEKTSQEFLKQIPDFTATFLGWLLLVGKERTHALLNNNQRFDPWNANILRGLVWALSSVEPTEEIARAITQLVKTSLKKIPGIGPRNPKLANAGVLALGRMNTNFAVAQLARLKSSVTFKSTLKEIEKALDESARRAGITKEDLEEIAVPTFGLEANGVRPETFGNYRAELRCVGNDVQLIFFDANNKQLKSVPASIKKEFSEELKELKTAQKDIEGMLGATKARIEKLHNSQKTWSFSEWQERYVLHPLVGQIARRLIWTLDGVPVAFHPERGLENLQAQPRHPNGTTRVALWHPIHFETQTVLAWRNWLQDLGIVQPWKQAYREIYVLTAAEINTNTYSNRFAAHIIKQHQFAQLAALRGWKNKLRLSVDDSYPPATLELPEYGLRAEYWVEGIGDNYGVDTTETGTYLRLVTDQVRFYAIDAPQNHAHAGGGGYEMWLYNGANPVEPLPLEHIPALVLSEVLRDVDLFVGVCSVGNDPTWQDGGPEGRYRDYWQSYSFGELNATAITRKEILETLLPRLKIRNQVSLDGKFLTVRGSLREYKIHLGSGNILMTPNDQYLCIVPDANQKENNESMFLPFEGDRTLAIVLSKAFLLADDTKITDPTIVRQIRS